MLQVVGAELVGCVLLSEVQAALLRLASQHRLTLVLWKKTAFQSRQPAESRSLAANWVPAGFYAQLDLVADHLHNVTFAKLTRVA